MIYCLFCSKKKYEIMLNTREEFEKKCHILKKKTLIYKTYVLIKSWNDKAKIKMCPYLLQSLVLESSTGRMISAIVNHNWTITRASILKFHQGIKNVPCQRSFKIYPIREVMYMTLVHVIPGKHLWWME
jgi:hypothetical protein